MNKDNIFVIGFDKSGETSNGSPSDFIANEYNFSKDYKNINGRMILNLDMNDYYYTNRPVDLFPSCKDSFLSEDHK